MLPQEDRELPATRTGSPHIQHRLASGTAKPQGCPGPQSSPRHQPATSPPPRGLGPSACPSEVRGGGDGTQASLCPSLPQMKPPASWGLLPDLPPDLPTMVLPAAEQALSSQQSQSLPQAPTTPQTAAGAVCTRTPRPGGSSQGQEAGQCSKINQYDWPSMAKDKKSHDHIH